MVLFSSCPHYTEKYQEVVFGLLALSVRADGVNTQTHLGAWSGDSSTLYNPALSDWDPGQENSRGHFSPLYCHCVTAMS